MHKILVADDSLTIQKVIKITLANEAFELIECLKSDQIKTLVDSESPDMVLLDFNLSEDKTGYELASDILELKSDAQILMLFGTFDTIDEDLLKHCGVKYKIVKPFDGSKFISLCHTMRDGLDEELPGKISSEPTQIINLDEDEEWVMDSPSSDMDDFEEVDSFEDDSEVGEKTEKINLDSLQASIEDWAMDVPSIIGTKNSNDLAEIPGIIPKIKHEEKLKVEEVVETSDPSLPSEDDLAFPSDDDLSFPEPIKMNSKPALVPLISLEDEIEEEDEDEEEKVEESINDLGINLEDEIEDEIDSEDLWSADEIEDIKETFKPLQNEDLPRIEPHTLTEVKKEQIMDTDISDSFDDMNFIDDAPSDFPADVMDEKKPIVPVSEPAVSISDQDIEEIVKKRMAPIVEELVKEYCQANIERIAWEVIPDLAENLIKKEIEKITKSILES